VTQISPTSSKTCGDSDDLDERAQSACARRSYHWRQWLSSAAISSTLWRVETRRHAKTPCRIIAPTNLKTGLSDRLEHLHMIRITDDQNSRLCATLGDRRAVDWIILWRGASPRDDLSPIPLETIDANVGGTRHVLELARQKRRRVSC